MTARSAARKETRANEAGQPSRKGGASVRVTTLHVDGDVYAVLAYPLGPPKLTSRLTSAEREVALLAIEGKSNAEIACLRRTSARTVANQLASCFRKLGVVSRAELAHACLAAGDAE